VSFSTFHSKPKGRGRIRAHAKLVFASEDPAPRRAGRQFAKPKRPKAKLGLPDLDHSKSAVLNSLRSPEPKPA
jgi:hypothetical protein